MDEQKKKLTEEEIRITEEIDALLDEVHENSDVVNIPLPERLERNIRKSIHARELEKIERAIDEELAKGEALLVAEAEAAQKMENEEVKELIRLGKIYKKRRKLHRYLVAAAVLVFVLALGVTSIGGPEKVFEKVNWMLAGREQTNVDSDDDDVVQLEGVEEEEVYQKIEDEYGFVPVRMYVLPDNAAFLEANMGDKIQGIYIIYGIEEKTKMTYFIRPNYRDGSLSKDVEDEFVEEYVEKTENTVIYIRKYCLEGEEERWSIQFEYQDVTYSMLIMDSNKVEVEKIVENLIFS